MIRYATMHLSRRTAIDECGSAWWWGFAQCSDNSHDVGSWYSLSAAGQCHGATKPDGVTCSWRAVEKLKTVNVRLFSKGKTGGGGGGGACCLPFAQSPFHSLGCACHVPHVMLHDGRGIRIDDG
jgi:hypothetical protein